MEDNLTPVHVRALQVIVKSFWFSHMDQATEQQMRIWLEGFQDGNGILKSLMANGYFIPLTLPLSRRTSVIVYQVSDEARMILSRNTKSTTSALPQILASDSPLRLPLTHRSVCHLLQVTHMIFGAGLLTVERLRFSHPYFGSRKLLKALHGSETEIARNGLNAQISSFLTAAESHGYLVAVHPEGYQKTTQGMALVNTTDVDLGLTERVAQK